MAEEEQRVNSAALTAVWLYESKCEHLSGLCDGCYRHVRAVRCTWWFYILYGMNEPGVTPDKQQQEVCSAMSVTCYGVCGTPIRWLCHPRINGAYGADFSLSLHVGWWTRNFGPIDGDPAMLHVWEVNVNTRQNGNAATTTTWHHDFATTKMARNEFVSQLLLPARFNLLKHLVNDRMNEHGRNTIKQLVSFTADEPTNHERWKRSPNPTSKQGATSKCGVRHRPAYGEPVWCCNGPGEGSKTDGEKRLVRNQHHRDSLPELPLHMVTNKAKLIERWLLLNFGRSARIIEGRLRRFNDESWPNRSMNRYWYLSRCFSINRRITCKMRKEYVNAKLVSAFCGRTCWSQKMVDRPCCWVEVAATLVAYPEHQQIVVRRRLEFESRKVSKLTRISWSAVCVAVFDHIIGCHHWADDDRFRNFR